MQFSFYLPCYWPDTSVHARVMYGEMLEQVARAEALKDFIARREAELPEGIG